MTMAEPKQIRLSRCFRRRLTQLRGGDFGLIGLAVMGQNLILNMADHGFTVIAFNRTVSKVDRFLENEAKGKSIIGAHSVEEFVQKLKKPRRMMMLVQAGQAVDDFIELIITSSSSMLACATSDPRHLEGGAEPGVTSSLTAETPTFLTPIAVPDTLLRKASDLWVPVCPEARRVLDMARPSCLAETRRRGHM